MKISLLGKILDFLLPRTCACCGDYLSGNEEMICIKCLFRMPWTNYWEHPYDNEMAKCFWHLIPIERCSALYYHVSKTQAAHPIYRLKYGNDPDIGIYLGEFLGEKGQRYNFFEGIDAIVPIPIARKREKERGYNQSYIIAKGIQNITHLPIIRDCVTRTVFVQSQTKKDRLERRINVDQVYRLADAYHDQYGKHPISHLAGKHLLIIDDVCTTGATITSCAQELMKAGKMKFSVLTVSFAHSI